MSVIAIGVNVCVPMAISALTTKQDAPERDAGFPFRSTVLFTIQRLVTITGPLVRNKGSVFLLSILISTRLVFFRVAL